MSYIANSQYPWQFYHVIMNILYAHTKPSSIPCAFVLSSTYFPILW